MKLKELQRRLNGFNLRAEAREVIIQTSGEIKRLNQEQLKRGELASGSPIINVKRGSNTYSPRYGRWRLARGLQVTHYDLKVSGQFWNSLTVEVKERAVNIDSPDAKAANLYSMFTERILGLTDESREIYRFEIFNPALRARIKSKLGI